MSVISDSFALPFDDPGDGAFPSDTTIRETIWEVLTEFHTLAEPGSRTTDRQIVDILIQRLSSQYPDIEAKRLTLSQKCEIPLRYRGQTLLHHRMVEQCKLLAAIDAISIRREHVGPFAMAVSSAERPAPPYHELHEALRELAGRPRISLRISDFANQIMAILADIAGFVDFPHLERRTISDLVPPQEQSFPTTDDQLVFTGISNQKVTQASFAVRTAGRFLEDLGVIEWDSRNRSRRGPSRLRLTRYGRQLQNYEDAVTQQPTPQPSLDVVAPEERTRRLFRSLQRWPLPDVNAPEMSELGLHAFKEGNRSGTITGLEGAGVLRHMSAHGWLAAGSAMCISDESLTRVLQQNAHERQLAWLAVDQLDCADEELKIAREQYRHSLSHHSRLGLTGHRRLKLLNAAKADASRRWATDDWLATVMEAIRGMADAEPYERRFTVQAIADEVAERRGIPDWARSTPSIFSSTTPEIVSRCGAFCLDLNKAGLLSLNPTLREGDPAALPSSRTRIYPTTELIDPSRPVEDLVRLLNESDGLQATSRYLPNIDLDVYQYRPTNSDIIWALIDDVRIANAIFRSPELRDVKRVARDTLVRSVSTVVRDDRAIRGDGRVPPWQGPVDNNTEIDILSRRIDRILRMLEDEGAVKRLDDGRLRIRRRMEKTELYRLLGPAWPRVTFGGQRGGFLNAEQNGWYPANWMYSMYQRLLRPEERPSGSKLRRRASARFEHFCSDLFAAKANQRTEVLGDSDNDRGIDVAVYASIDHDEPNLFHGVQCKQYMGRSEVGRRDIDAIHSDTIATAEQRGLPCGSAILVSTNSSFTDEALDQVQSLNRSNPMSVILVDGFRLLDIVAHTGVGLVLNLDGSVSIDSAYFDQLDQRVASIGR